MVKREVSFLDLFKWLNENSFLNDGKIRKVRSQKNTIFILIYRFKENWLKIVPGQYIAIYKPSINSLDLNISDFDRRIEKAFGNKRIKINLHKSDRIVEISAGDVSLIIELFSNGNIILLKDGIVEWAMYSRNYGVRKIVSNQKYVYPPESIDILDMNFEKFSDYVTKSDKSSIVKTLAVDFSLGGRYATEVCFRSGLTGNEPNSSLSNEILLSIYNNFMYILNEEVKPNIIDGDILSSIELRSVNGNKVYFNSVNEAILNYFEQQAKQDKSDINLGQKLEDTIKEKERVISFLNENFDKINDLINIARDSSKTLDERRKLIQEAGWTLDNKFLHLKSMEIEIDITKPLNVTISDLYNSIKRIRGKLLNKKGERHLLRLTPNIIDVWYSKFRWFYTSSNKLGVMGKDNNQNIALIKKYTDSSDLVLHADIFGSPFCILKNASMDDEEDILEAAIMTASYSSAWKNGLSSIDVYCVRREQVTLSPPSGESLKSGAFYIEGKRRYIKNCPLGIYLNIKIEDNKYELLATPKPYYKHYFSIKPGNKKAEDIIDKIYNTIADKLKVEISKNDISRFIPNGRSMIDAIKLD